VDSRIKFLPKSRCDWGGPRKRQIDHRTSPHRAYTPPTSSDGADYWCTLKLSVWALWFYVGLHDSFQPKTWCGLENVRKQRFGPPTWWSWAYTSPTGSVGPASMPHLVALILGFLGIHGCSWPIPAKNSVLQEGLSKNKDLDLKSTIYTLHELRWPWLVTHLAQSILSRHMWVHVVNSRQKLGVVGRWSKTVTQSLELKIVHTYAHKYIYIYMYVYICIWIYVCMYPCIYTCAYICVYIHTYAYVQICTCT